MLNPKRHIPNSLSIDLGSKLLDDPLVLPAFTRWQADNKGDSLSNYLDEIENEFDELERQGARNRIVSS